MANVVVANVLVCDVLVENYVLWCCNLNLNDFGVKGLGGYCSVYKMLVENNVLWCCNLVQYSAHNFKTIVYDICLNWLKTFA